MNREKFLVLKANTKSGSIYEVYKYDDVYILKSNSSAFGGADFILFNSLYIDERLNFNGKVYFNAQIELYEKKYRIIPRDKKKKVLNSELEAIQRTTRIVDLELINKREFKTLIKDKIISINDEFLEQYDLD
jgi:hypothetical protein